MSHHYWYLVGAVQGKSRNLWDIAPSMDFSNRICRAERSEGSVVPVILAADAAGYPLGGRAFVLNDSDSTFCIG